MLEDLAMYKYIALFALMAASISLSACNLPAGCPMSDNPIDGKVEAKAAAAGINMPDNSGLCY